MRRRRLKLLKKVIFFGVRSAPVVTPLSLGFQNSWRYLARKSWGPVSAPIHTLHRLEPLPVDIDERDCCDRNVKNGANERRDLLELRLGWRVEGATAVQRSYSALFVAEARIMWQLTWPSWNPETRQVHPGSLRWRYRHARRSPHPAFRRCEAYRTK